MIFKENFIFTVPFDLKHKSGIYYISSDIDPRIYVGSAKSLWGRFSRHINKLGTQEHKNLYLQNFYNKHPEATFIFELLEHVSDLTTLVDREQFWLDKTECYKHDIGFNICINAKSAIGVKRSEEFKAKFKGEKNYMFGRKHTPEELRKISEAGMGNQYWKLRKPCSRENREKMGAAKRIPIVHVSKTGEFIKEYHSAAQAATKLSLHKPSITAVCKNKKTDVKGHYFQYKSEYLAQGKIIPEVAPVTPPQAHLNISNQIFSSPTVSVSL